MKKLSTTLDSILLGGFARERAIGKVLDLGTGNGVVANMVAGSEKVKRVIGVDLNKLLLKKGMEKKRDRGLEKVVCFLQADIKEIPKIFKERVFNTIVTNPPFRKLNAGKISSYNEKAIANHEIMCNLDNILEASRHVLTHKGKLIMVYLPERLDELMRKMDSYGLVPKIIQMVHSFKDSPCGHVLICGYKDAAHGLTILSPHIVYKARGEYTRETEIYYSYTLHG